MNECGEIRERNEQVCKIERKMSKWAKIKKLAKMRQRENKQK